MHVLLEIGASNAVMATLLALLTATVGYVVRRPALEHCLWVLVFVKLLTPPLLPVPIATKQAAGEATAEVLAAAVLAGDAVARPQTAHGSAPSAKPGTRAGACETIASIRGSPKPAANAASTSG